MSQITNPETAGGAVAALGPRDFLRIIRKHVWLIVACFVVFGLGGTAALIAWYYEAPYFTAEGVVEVTPGQQRTPFDTAGGNVIPVNFIEQYIRGQIMIVKSYNVLRDALKAVGDKQSMYLEGQNPIEELEKDLEVSYIPQTQNFVVRLTGRHPEQVKEIVNAVLAAYLADLEQKRKTTEAERKGGLVQKQKELEATLTNAEQKLTNIRDESGAVVLSEQGSEEMARLAALTRQLVDIQFRLAEARAAWEQFQQLQQVAEQSQDVQPIIQAYPDIMQGLRTDRSLLMKMQEVSSVQADLDTLKQRYGPKNETVKRLEARLQTASNELEAQQRRTLVDLLQQQGAVLKAEYQRLQEAEADVSDKVGEARSAAIRVTGDVQKYQVARREFDRARDLLDTVVDGMAQMDIQSALARPNIRVVNQANAPIEPSQPRLPIYIPAVVLFSLLLGVGLAILVEFMDTRIRTPLEIARQVGVPILGSVPDLAEDDRLRVDTDVAKVSQVAPESLLAEAFRQARTNLLFASDQALKSLLVTSPTPGDGKTTAAVNLAITMARSGARVLLIEANFRRPALKQLFDVPDRVGLSNVLVGLNPIEEAIQATRIENLDVIVGGPMPPSPADLLGSSNMRRLVREQAAQYDHVVIDGAPVLVVADAHLLAEAVDGVVLVLRAGENTRGMAARAARVIRGLRARLLGAVLNGVRATKGGYFREAYQAYYDYARADSRSVLSRSTPHAFGEQPAARPEAGHGTATAVAEPPKAEAEGEDVELGPKFDDLDMIDEEDEDQPKR